MMLTPSEPVRARAAPSGRALGPLRPHLPMELDCLQLPPEQIDPGTTLRPLSGPCPAGIVVARPTSRQSSDPHRAQELRESFL
jgi:hypothetical protein